MGEESPLCFLDPQPSPTAPSFELHACCSFNGSRRAFSYFPSFYFISLSYRKICLE